MKLQIVEDYETLSSVTAAIVADEIERQGPVVLLPATGSTPTGAYQQLALRHAARELDSSQITLVQLDEYVDIAPDDRRSLFGWMKTTSAPAAISQARSLRGRRGNERVATLGVAPSRLRRRAKGKGASIPQPRRLVAARVRTQQRVPKHAPRRVVASFQTERACPRAFTRCPLADRENRTRRRSAGSDGNGAEAPFPTARMGVMVTSMVRGLAIGGVTGLVAGIVVSVVTDVAFAPEIGLLLGLLIGWGLSGRIGMRDSR
jgi:hypothetical protein